MKLFANTWRRIASLAGVAALSLPVIAHANTVASRVGCPCCAMHW
ncbi:hypothetical protein [Dyella acidiphila]|nr:hypothetical protein [Dyella acidiphila]